MHKIIIADEQDLEATQELKDQTLNKNETVDNSFVGFSKSVNPEEIFIRFQVFNSKGGKSKETLIGQSLIQAHRLIDLEETRKTT